MFIRLGGLLGIAALCTLLSGCSDGSSGGDRLKVYEVKGKITLSNSPVAGASVVFTPAQGSKGRAAIGKTDDEGNYTLTTYDSGDGAAEGDYLVVVTKNTGSNSSGSFDEAAAHEAAMKGGTQSSHSSQSSKKENANALPDKYGDSAKTDLKATVKSGEDNVFNFDLKP